MSAGILISIDGETVDLADATWYMVAPCGCTSGASVAYSDYGRGPALVVATPEQAFAQFWDSKAEREKYERLGFTVEAGRRQDITERMGGTCPHEPRYGYSIPQPDGLVWAVGGYRFGGDATRTLHLIPAGDANRSDYGGGDTVALCGRARKFHWSTDSWDMDGKVECSLCMKKAGEQA